MSLVGSVLSEESVLSPELFPGPQFSDFSSSFSVSSVSFSLSFTLTVSVVSSVEAVSSFLALSSVWEVDVSGTEGCVAFWLLSVCFPEEPLPEEFLPEELEGAAFPSSYRPVSSEICALIFFTAEDGLYSVFSP